MNDHHFPRRLLLKELGESRDLTKQALLPPLLLREKKHQRMVTFFCSVLFELLGACQKRSADLR